MRISDWSSDVCSSDLGNQHALAADGGEQQLHKLPEAVDLGAAQLVGLATAGGFAQRLHDGGSDVAHVDRLETGAAAANQRQRRRAADNPGAAVEQTVLRAEDNRGPEDDRDMKSPRLNSSQ